MIQKKSAKGDLENRKGTFLTLGLVLVLGLVYAGLELFATQDKGPGFVMADEEVIMMMEEEVMATDQAPPPEPPPAQQQTEAVLEIVDDDTQVEDNWDMFNQEFDENETVQDIVQVEMVEETVEEIPVRFAQNPPEFPGGMEALYKFLGENLKYPQTAVDLGLEGMVIVEFVVEKDGKPSNAKIHISSAKIFEAEALRIIGAMPKWKPAVHNGKTVRSYYQLPIQFKFQ
ncbi:energy transducer TonB [Bacteroidales bacterium OttesenSCG-928-B11]|nr:energy transducer TonB [Bacteroidales bacterium OttesenSCG-928-C03]MDL2311837.1 energy transducer TonB [Bacteroidales bacterium OttesenSCG-928-B11]MDL2325513.1 energy transducer TonB [Bacteroidales bacterium OttesenSCG-928-A14]